MKKFTILEQRTDNKVISSEKDQYQDITGSLMFSIMETRLDIAFATIIVSCFAKNPGHQYTEVVKTILRYLKGLREHGITYGSHNKLLVESYSIPIRLEIKKAGNLHLGSSSYLIGVQ